ncbi:MAG TPA: hypothetical protein VNA69_24700 [Thermoanaerobaculia bacterium]|nr:hypothetical protein [Thermoanaerobaculia bacterium]
MAAFYEELASPVEVAGEQEPVLREIEEFVRAVTSGHSTSKA